MLQPNQPMGMPNMAATGPQGAKPQQPQQPQMPAGQMLSGVAGGGLGSILDNVARPYAGNPQALEQKGMSGDLLAALAAQRLKSQKEHALQQLQLQAAGQQGGQPQKTVVEQNEDALLELTKQEMTQEQADTLKQKQGQMQEGQKRLMQQAMQQAQPGIAGIPAPNAAEPRAMAAGGIVAFAGNDPEVGSYVGYDIGGGEYTPSSGTGLMGALPQVRSQSPEEQARINELLEKYRGRIQYKQARAIAEGRMSEDELNRPVGTVQPGAQPGTGLATSPAPENRPAGQGQQRTDTRQVREPQGVASLPGRGDPLTAALNKNLAIDPSEVTAAERKSAYEFMKPSDEDMAARREGLASLKALNAAENDPDRQWVRRVLRTLPSRGTSFMANTLGDVGAGALAARDEEYARQLQGIGNEEKMLKGIMSDVYQPKKEAVGAGTSAGQQASGLLGHAMSSAAHTRAAELQAAASRETAAAMRDANNFNRLSATLASVQDKRREAYNDVLTRYPVYAALSQKNPADLSKSEKTQLDEQKNLILQDMKINVSGFDEQINMLRQALMRGGNMPKPSAGTTSQTGYSAERIQ